MAEAEFLVKLGESIKKHRELLGINQSALALRCETDRQNMSRIEKGRVNISMTTLKKIADALEVPVKNLVDFK
jgi:transcriptional regulator with XRE-family HTH domain